MPTFSCHLLWYNFNRHYHMQEKNRKGVIQLFHNPTAGDEAHNQEKLTSLIESEGYQCRYSSTKKSSIKDFDDEASFIVIAGGDGTVRKISKKMLDRKVLDHHWPVAVLPLGTANNIAKTLGLDKPVEEIVRSWEHCEKKKFDVGRIINIEEAHFFLESFGYGLFPYLMKEMKKRNKEAEPATPEEALFTSLKVLHEILLSYKPRYCDLQIDGVDHSGKYLLVEIMNTKSIGPNLFLSPDADPGDGKLEVVMIPEGDKDLFAEYVKGKINGQEVDYDFSGVHARDVKISWDGTHVHVDDEVLKLEKNHKVEIELKEGLLEFLV